MYIILFIIIFVMFIITMFIFIVLVIIVLIIIMIIMMHMQTLRTLNVAHNGIGPDACLVLCVGVRESNVTSLVIDGNPIGELGGRMLMTLPLMRNRDGVLFSCIACSIAEKSRSTAQCKATVDIEGDDAWS